MAIKKSELYSSLWDSCDALRGSMDASQYKDYVLVMLFVKYISDKWTGQPYAPIIIPEGASFQDMIQLKGKPDIGDQINKKILAPIATANHLNKFPDFNDSTKLGSGKEMVDTLTSLIAIFENPALDFSKNKADGDDILGDAYEYLMRHFATQSGKSKGQFYTPAEVSRTMAKIIGIHQVAADQEVTVYDPTCGSGSLLLKVGEVATGKVSLYGQEKDSATAGLAKMNMIIHGSPTAEIRQGNTLAKPLFQEGHQQLKTFDFIIANPPFSDKRWTAGLTLPDDPYGRFEGFGVPPDKNGDYAFLLHMVRSLKRHGKGAVILPHGVLFRGNAEATIRTNLIKKGYIRAIIGLPANLFYGTGIPAAIVFIDKEQAQHRKGIFMIDAGKDYIKDGNKNRLREQDIRKITDVFAAQQELPGYSRMVSLQEIADNAYNLNIPRYIDNQEQEDVQDIDAHLKGGIPMPDLDQLADFWTVFPSLRTALFQPLREGYAALAIPKESIKSSIYEHPEFKAFMTTMDAQFEAWRSYSTTLLKGLEQGHKPKAVIAQLSEQLLQTYQGKPLIDAYNVYQLLLSYWNNTMQDDCYLIAADGWVATTYRIVEKDKKGKEKDKGWACDLLPKSLVIAHYFQAEQRTIDQLHQDKATLSSQIAELEETHSGEEGAFAQLDKINKANANKRLKALKKESDEDLANEQAVLEQYVQLHSDLAKTNKAIKTAEAALDDQLYPYYDTLTPAQVQTLVVDHKWMHALQTALQTQINHTSQRLTNRINELAERYATPLPALDQTLQQLEDKVAAHLAKMGFTWN